MIEGVRDIREAYRDPAVAAGYIDQRFRDPLGAQLHANQAAALRRLIRRHAPAQVLEIAPGPGRLTTEVARLVKSGTVVEASAPMLAEARRRLGAAGAAWQFINADAFRLPLRREFDLVYAFRFVRHFDGADRARLYAGIARVLRPGGWFMCDAVNEAVSAPLRGEAAPGEYRHYDALHTPAGLRAELGAAGLEVVGLQPVQRRYRTLRAVQMLVAPRSPALARLAMAVIDRSGGAPLEWIVTCRRV